MRLGTASDWIGLKNFMFFSESRSHFPCPIMCSCICGSFLMAAENTFIMYSKFWRGPY